ncbi:hypothetical protein ACQY0O_000893 [Thecaphora frezii]
MPSPTLTPPAPAPALLRTHAQALLVRTLRQGWTQTFDLVPHHPRPRLVSPSQVLVRVRYVGLNPVDWKSVMYRFGIASLPWILGRDVVGEVQQVGAQVTRCKVDDIVWICTDARDPSAGVYQRYCVAHEAILARLPSAVQEAEAATLGTGLVTAIVVVWWFLRLPRPAPLPAVAPVAADAALAPTPPRRTPQEVRASWVVIYGGGSVTGIYVAQLARQSGVSVVAVASPDRFSYLESLGVSACLDRHDDADTLLARLRGATRGGSLDFAIDCVGSKTANVCLRALTDANRADAPPAELVCLAGNAELDVERHEDGSVRLEGANARRVRIHKLSFSTTQFYKDAQFSQTTLDDVTYLLASRSLHPVESHLIADGLAGIRRGLELFRDGTAPRGKKLVARIDDTPCPDVRHLGVRSDLGWNGAV